MGQLQYVEEAGIDQWERNVVDPKRHTSRRQEIFPQIKFLTVPRSCAPEVGPSNLCLAKFAPQMLQSQTNTG